MSNNSVISIDLAKNVFQVCLLNENNKVSKNTKVSRSKLLDAVTKLDANRVVMEACYSSNYWGRLFEKQGYKVDLIPPHQVKPFVVGNKNDSNDVVAIAEASLRPRATFVRVKSYEQQDIQSLDRIRDRLLKTRTALSNQIRGFLAEYGLVFKVGIRVLRAELPFALEDAENSLTYTAREFLRDMELELLSLDKRIKKVEAMAAELLSVNELYGLLQTIPGIGPVIARVILCSINDADQFKNGRQMAAWIGITPKQHASGDSSRMLGISKRGNRTLRRQLIHGARAVIRTCEDKNDPLNLWIKKLLLTKPVNKVAVALANKMVRIAWSLLKTGDSYNSAMLVNKT